jgi:aminoglycoside phosphotransferase (APT) family kinase protein
MDALSERALRSWMDERLGSQDRFELRLIQGGRSNLSYRVTHGDHRYVLRRPPFGAVLEGAHDVLREFRLLQSLDGTPVPLARPVAACEDAAVIGADFTLVEFLDGAALRTSEEVAALPEVARGEVTRSFGAALAALHRVDPERVGRPREKGFDHAERQLRVWSRQLQAEPARPLPLLDALGAHLRSCRPEQREVAIVHGDYRLDNVMVGADGAVVGVLDWELWTLGDPTLDLGNTLAYWTESAFELFALGSSPTAGGLLGTRDDVLEAYLAAGGPEFTEDALAWALSFGFWRYAVILEGVYRRNLAGAYGEAPSDDWQRFAHVVPAMAEVGWQLRPR